MFYADCINLVMQLPLAVHALAIYALFLQPGTSFSLNPVHYFHKCKKVGDNYHTYVDLCASPHVRKGVSMCDGQAMAMTIFLLSYSLDFPLLGLDER